MDEKAVIGIDVVDVESNEFGLNEDQARQIALSITFDIIDYIKRNQEEYLKYLKDEESK